MLWLAFYLFFSVVRFLKSFSGISNRARLLGPFCQIGTENKIEDIDNDVHFEEMFEILVNYVKRTAVNMGFEALMLNTDQRDIFRRRWPYDEEVSGSGKNLIIGKYLDRDNDGLKEYKSGEFSFFDQRDL